MSCITNDKTEQTFQSVEYKQYSEEVNVGKANCVAVNDLPFKSSTGVRPFTDDERATYLTKFDGWQIINIDGTKQMVFTRTHDVESGSSKPTNVWFNDSATFVLNVDKTKSRQTDVPAQIPAVAGG